MKQSPRETFRYMDAGCRGASRATFCFLGSDDELAPMLEMISREADQYRGSPDVRDLVLKFFNYDGDEWPDLSCPSDQIKRNVCMASIPFPLGWDVFSRICAMKVEARA